MRSSVVRDRVWFRLHAREDERVWGLVATAVSRARPSASDAIYSTANVTEWRVNTPEDRDA